jgi:HAMP domain-containing protein
MTAALVVGAVVLVVLVALAAAAAGRRRQPTDDIASFRRQIDALSPEARRQTSDRMKPSERAASGDDGADDT